MARLFLLPFTLDGSIAVVTGTDHNHISRVLRMRVGEAIEILDNSGAAYTAIIRDVAKERTLVEVTGTINAVPEPPIRITVAQAVGKGDKFEQVVQHGTEVGASRFAPIFSERCVVQPPADKVRAANQLARWSLIAKLAAEQCGRSRIPEVASPIKLAELISCDSDDVRICLHLSPQTQPLRAVLSQWETPPKSLTIAVGPEGGWSRREAEAAAQSGWNLCSLGARVLRTETAALAAVAAILYHFEELETSQ